MNTLLHLTKNYVCYMELLSRSWSVKMPLLKEAPRIAERSEKEAYATSSETSCNLGSSEHKAGLLIILLDVRLHGDMLNAYQYTGHVDLKGLILRNPVTQHAYNPCWKRAVCPCL